MECDSAKHSAKQGDLTGKINQWTWIGTYCPIHLKIYKCMRNHPNICLHYTKSADQLSFQTIFFFNDKHQSISLLVSYFTSKFLNTKWKTKLCIYLWNTLYKYIFHNTYIWQRILSREFHSLRPSDVHTSLNEAIIGSNNKLLPIWYTAIIWINACVLLACLENEHQWNFHQNSIFFIEGDAFEIVVYEMMTILSQPQFVKT